VGTERVVRKLRRNYSGKGGTMSDAIDPMFAWYVWGLLIIGTFLMTLIGTWLIARRWEK
jgi:ABC-type antimicrobial peptide transport system permease subunit